MAHDQGWSEPSAAQAAVNDPSTPTFDLLAICMARPELRASVALHPNADVHLLTWIAGQDEPVAAATASSRLALLSAAPQPPVPAAGWQAQPQPAFSSASASYAQAQYPASAQVGSAQPQHYPAQPQVAAISPGAVPRRRSRFVLWSGVGIVGLAAVVVAAVVIVPWLLDAGSYDYAPDLRDQPGLVSVDAQQGLPSGDYHWYTSFYEAPDAGFVIGSNSTSAFDDYQTKLSEYNDAQAMLREWEADYQSGYAAGKVCLSESSDTYYYNTRADYCYDYMGYYLDDRTSADEAGFVDSVNGLAASPDHPGNSNYSAPLVPVKPELPTVNANLVGIDLKTGRIGWRLELATLWPDAQPRVAGLQTSGDNAVMVLEDETTADDATGPELLAVLNVKTGVVTASTTLNADRDVLVRLHGDIVVLADKDGALRGVKTSDLATSVWTSSAHPYWWHNDESPLWVFEIPGDYLLTDDGYVRMTDGQRADFARDAGQDLVQLSKLNGTKDQLIRIQGHDDGYDIAGFDAAKDEQTWKLSGVMPEAWSAGGYVIAVSGGDVTAYRVNGDDLDRKWRYSCDGDCSVAFADNSRVVVSEWKSSRVVVVNTADGEKLDSVDNSDGNIPLAGRSVLYLRQDHRLIARDLNKSGLAALWRSIAFDGSLLQVGDQFVIENNGEDVGKLGILGLDGDDWNDFRAKEG